MQHGGDKCEYMYVRCGREDHEETLTLIQDLQCGRTTLGNCFSITVGGRDEYMLSLIIDGFKVSNISGGTTTSRM